MPALPRVREVEQALRKLGCQEVRCEGSHRIYRTPGGRPVTLKINHSGDQISRVVLTTARRILRQEGLEIFF